MITLEVSRDELKEVLSKVYGAVGSAGSEISLQCFCFKGGPDGLKIAASNRDNTLISKSPLSFDEEFEFIVPAVRFMSIIKGCSVGFVNLCLSGNILKITSGTSVWEVKVPSLKFPSSIKSVKMEASADGDEFRKAIRATRKSISDSPFRPNLHMLDVSKGKVTACDSIRLTQAALGDYFPKDFQTAVPYKSVELLWAMIKDRSIKEVAMGVSASFYSFSVPGTELLVKKLNSRFPDVEQILLRPALENKNHIVVDRAELATAVDRVRINADPETDAVGLFLSAKSLTVTTRDINGNSSSSTLPSSWEGKDRMLIVNYVYLQDLIKSTDTEVCHMYIGEDAKSRKSVLLIKDEDEGVLGIVPQLAGNLRVM